MLFGTLSEDNNKNKSSTRQLVLKPIEGLKAKTTTGLVDARLFKNENKLLAVMDHKTTLWTMRYEAGVTPEELRVMYTSFPKLLEAARRYFLKRNVEIVDVIE